MLPLIYAKADPKHLSHHPGKKRAGCFTASANTDYYQLTGLFNYQSRQVSSAIDKKIIGSQYAFIQHKLEDAVDRPRQITNLFLQYIQGESNNIDKDTFLAY